MRRKIIRQGNKSFTLTLPAEWVKEHNLKGGDEVDISQEDYKLLVSAASYAKRPDVNISLDLKDYNERSTRSILNQAYRKGFDTIRLLYSNPEQLKDIRQITKDSLLGFEIVKEDANAVTLQNIAEPSSEKYEVILRKLFYLIKEDGKRMLEEFRQGKLSSVKEIEESKATMDTFTNFLRRIIINHKVGGARNSYLYYYLVSQLSLLQHAYFYLYKFLSRQKSIRLGKETLELLANANQMFDILHESLYKKDITLAHAVHVLKDKLLRQDCYGLLQKKKGVENVALFHIGEIIRLIHLCSTVIFGLLEEPEQQLN